MLRRCSKCKNDQEESTHFQFRSEGRYRTTCRKCRSSEQNVRNKERREDNDELLYWRTRAYSSNNPYHRSRSASKTMEGKLRSWDLKELYERHKKCHYCSVSLEKEQAELDHSIPVCRDGSHDIKNIRICCHDCNQLKGTKTEEEFISFLQNYIQRFNICGASV